MRGARKRGEARGRGGRWAKHRGNHAEPGAGSSRRAIARGFFSVLLDQLDSGKALSKRDSAELKRPGLPKPPTTKFRRFIRHINALR